MESAIQRAVVRHFAGGDALFSGIALLVLSVACMSLPRVAWRSRIARLFVVSGSLIVAASAIPLPGWFYVLGAVAAILWLVTLGRTASKSRMTSAILLLVWCAFAAGIELEWRARPIPSSRSFSEMVVIGDSISAGLSDSKDSTWPARFAAMTGVKVVNLSRAGATARSALAAAEKLKTEDALILVEIGGNDLLGGRSSEEFGEDLDRLLGSLAQPGRVIVLLELPLPPLYNDYGRRQRTSAAKYSAAVIPRRDFARVLFTNDATLDDLHLSDKGHAAMAEMVRTHLEPLLQTRNTE